jgi:hypothetical protein
MECKVRVAFKLDNDRCCLRSRSPHFITPIEYNFELIRDLNKEAKYILNEVSSLRILMKPISCMPGMSQKEKLTH